MGPYLYKAYLYVFFFKIPNRSCILAMPHFALFCSPPACLCMRCSWPRPPAKEGAEARASCYHAVTMLLPCCYHAVTMPRQPLIPLIGGELPIQAEHPRCWRVFKSESVCIKSVAALFFLDLGMEEKREGFIFWRCVSSPTHQGHICIYKRHHKVHFAW